MLERERREGERKAIEADGIRRVQETVSQTISDSYLRWQRIDATLRLGQSPNAKVVVIGNGGSGGLPLILGGISDSPPSSPAPPGSPLPVMPSSPVASTQQPTLQPEPETSTP